MSGKKNQYASKSKKQSFLNGFDSPATVAKVKGHTKESSIETGKDLVIGAVAGGGAGLLLGRPSLLVGLLAAGLGHYYGSNSAIAFGIGMMASGSAQMISGVNGTPSGLGDVKDRLVAFKDGLIYRLYLDKMLASKKTTKTEDKKTEETNGVGEVQYFVYPNKELEGTEELDLAALDQIERQIAESGEEYSKRSSMGMLTTDDSVGELDPSERNF